MPRWPLLGGAYEARSVLASAQRCVNLFPERNPKDSPTPVTYYQRPGLAQLLPGYGVARCFYVASNNVAYCVSGETVYLLESDWTVRVLGTISNKLTPVKMVDNGQQVMVLDGSTSAWTIDMTTQELASYTDSTGLFQGATYGAHMDTFTLFNKPGTNQFLSTLSNTFEFDATYVAAKATSPDALQGVAVVHRSLWLVGTQTTEVWDDVGAEDFPFQIRAGVFIEYGAVAPYSIATGDASVFWLARNRQGEGMVLKGLGYKAERISNHALEWALQKYRVIEDAIAYTYQEDGHIFYVLSFPTEDKTWVYDEATEEWHQRAWCSPEGRLLRHRVAFGGAVYGKVVGLDWETGALYEQSTEITDDAGAPLVCVRSFPHLPTIQLGPQQTISLSGKRVRYMKFMADIQTGTSADTTTPPPAQATIVNTLDYDDGADGAKLYVDIAGTASGLPIEVDPPPPDTLLATEGGDTLDADIELRDPDEIGILLDIWPGGEPGPKIRLRWSNDRGASWAGSLTQTLGATGKTLTMPTWRQLGVARDRVWELSWNANAKVALQGAWVDLRVLKS